MAEQKKGPKTSKSGPTIYKKEHKEEKSLLKMFDKTLINSGEVASLVTGMRLRTPDLVMKNGKKRAL